MQTGISDIWRIGYQSESRHTTEEVGDNTVYRCTNEASPSVKTMISDMIGSHNTQAVLIHTYSFTLAREDAVLSPKQYCDLDTPTTASAPHGHTYTLYPYCSNRYTQHAQDWLSKPSAHWAGKFLAAHRDVFSCTIEFARDRRESSGAEPNVVMET